MMRPFGAALLVLLALSACVELEQMKSLQLGAEPPPPAEPPAPAPRPFAELSDDMPPIPQRKPNFARRLRQQLDADRAVTDLQANADPPAALDPTVIVDPNALIGLDFERTANILGSPTRLIEQPPALIWAYDTQGCDLRVFFYPRVAGSEFRALAYKIDETNSAVTSANEGAYRRRLRSCLNRLIALADGSEHLVKIEREKAISP